MTIQQAFEVALQHHQSGRLVEAEALYRQILTVDPRHADALHYLGVIAHQVGQNDAAVGLIRQAIALAPGVPETHSNIGECYRALGQLDEAIATYRQAIALKPNYPDAHNNLGNALREKGQLDEAVAAFSRATALQPNFADAYSNLGNALQDKGRLEEAIAAYRQAIALKPNFPEAYSNLGNALRNRGQVDEAIAAYHQAITLKPNYPEAHSNLGNALRDSWQLDEAIAAFRQAIALKPNFPEACSNLGNALRDNGQLDEALGSYLRAIALKPNFPEAQYNLGNALRENGQLDEAIAALQEAITLQPNSPEAHNNLGVALKDKGQLDEAIAAYHRAIDLKPAFADAHSNLVFALHYHPGRNAETVAEKQRSWALQHATALKQFIQPHHNDPNPNRRLRIGYVSPDLRDHVVGRYLMPLFEHHGSTQFELLCYSGVRRPDEMTARFRSLAGQWRSTVGVGDQQVAELIREDGVDILVDCSLHSAENRLLVFARRPAPVQVSYAGYPGSTGLEAIEYRISDKYLEAEALEFPSAGSGQAPIRSLEIGSPRPPDLPSSISHSEPALSLSKGPAKRVFLLESFWCYDPRGMEVAVNELPAMKSKVVTFGCLNNFCKVNDRVLALWARILGQLEGSRLLLLSPAGSHRERTLALLRQLGVEGSRVEFVEGRPRREYLEWYQRIDIGLETFPYGGHTTSLDAFWMGVPVPALVGELPVSRAGLSHLTNLGLPELVARSEEEYVNLVVELAGDLPRLAGLRATLRERMRASVLVDAPRYARQIEQAYRQMWEHWCARKT